MAFYKTFSLLITLATLLSSIGLLPPPVAAGEISSQTSSLALEVCSNTSDPGFCRRVMSADPRSPAADEIVIAYIAFSATYNHASTTSDLIQKRIKEASHEKVKNLVGLTGCHANYTGSGQAMIEALGNLDSETYTGFDKLAERVERATKDCEAGFSVTPSPMAKENGDMMKLANICSVVATLFSYSD